NKQLGARSGHCRNFGIVGASAAEVMPGAGFARTSSREVRGYHNDRYAQFDAIIQGGYQDGLTASTRSTGNADPARVDPRQAMDKIQHPEVVNQLYGSRQTPPMVTFLKLQE